ncbi:hypothetical protein HDU77_001843 [Chytriomyces hyalinus]|nr:hypothetical protein HDU77_001843 [Chytriomyces hyalinus]
MHLSTIALSAVLATTMGLAAPARLVVGLNQTCGGFAGTACTEGLTCVLDAFSTAGKCTPKASLGQVCGGTNNPACADNLSCSDKIKGVCKIKASDLGQTCGGFVGTGCNEGLTCVLDAFSSAGKCMTQSSLGQVCGGSSNAVCADRFSCSDKVKGVCKVKASDIGQTCGGFVGTGCKDGLTCVYDKFSTGGKCMAKVSLGQVCGGANNPACADGLSCSDNIKGVCKLEAAGLNQSCGGFVGKPCESGLACVLDQFSTAGKCVANVGFGKTCGGVNNPACAEGFVCSDKTKGVCQKK